MERWVSSCLCWRSSASLAPRRLQALDRLGLRMQGDYGFQVRQKRLQRGLPRARALSRGFTHFRNASSLLLRIFALFVIMCCHSIAALMRHSLIASCFHSRIYSLQETLSRHRPVLGLRGASPSLPRSGFIAPSASVIGDVKLGEGSSVWCVAKAGSALAETSLRTVYPGARASPCSPHVLLLGLLWGPPRLRSSSTRPPPASS